MGKNEKKEKKKVPKRIKISIGIIAIVLVAVIVATVLMQSSSVSLMGLSSQKTFASAEAGTVTMVEDTSTGKTIYVPVPAGYTASTATGENTVAEGLVIYEGTEAVTNDNVEEARTTRNQYVWIPVDDASELYETDEDGKKWGKLYEYNSSLKTASDLVDDGLENVIGATVTGYDDYEYSDSDVGWLIFYADDENIYLIADDYIEYEYIPENSEGHKPDSGKSSFLRSAYFGETLLNDYKGSASITDSILQALNSSYYNNSYESTSYNMKAVAYMMDTDAWSVYAGSAADYAIGGPTIELLMKSYSAKYEVDYQARASSSTGYQISTDGGSTWETYMSSSSEYLNSDDKTYVINEITNAYGMWIASPSEYDTDRLMGVYSDGYVYYYSYAGGSYGDYGFRPVVCLSSDVKLQKNEDGTYTIVEDERTAITDGTSTDSTSYREPVILSDYDSDDYLMEYSEGYENGHELLADLETEFNEMIESVEKWGGFYIGRYETGDLSEDTPVVVQGNDDISNQTWYEMYEKCKELGNSTDDVTTGMIFGSQWDAALQYFIDIGDKEYSEIVSSSSWGNYSGSIETTGSDETWSACNVYDMAGNVSEWTIEAYGTDNRIARGGSYDGSSSAANRAENTPETSSSSLGCRVAMWLDTDLEEGDTVVIKPVLTGIAVTTPPTTTTYTEGDSFDSTGMVITATYSDGSTKEISSGEYTITDGDNLTVDKTSVTISYTEDNVTVTTTQEITVEEKSIIGSYVIGYDDYDYVDADVDWIIFYIDDENIYLIADDYIPYAYIPSNSSGNKPTRYSTSYTAAAYFSTTLINNYTGSASITDSRLKALNNSYYSQNYSSTSNNMKAVAYMMDTDAWSVYKGKVAEYAIGGPTIELLMESYSAKYGVDYQAKASSSIGYQISTNGGSTWSNYMTSSSDYLNTSDRTYVINSTSGAYGMWIASPSAYGSGNLMVVDYDGYVAYTIYSNYNNLSNRGFRPLVCLKSEVRLQENEDGTYTIIYDGE